MSIVTCAWGASIVFGPAVSGKECMQVALVSTVYVMYRSDS